MMNKQQTIQETIDLKQQRHDVFWPSCNGVIMATKPPATNVSTSLTKNPSHSTVTSTNHTLSSNDDDDDATVQQLNTVMVHQNQKTLMLTIKGKKSPQRYPLSIGSLDN